MLKRPKGRFCYAEDVQPDAKGIKQQVSKQLPARSAVLVVRGGQILLIERKKTGRPPYYTLPGGGIEQSETPEQAARREMREELGVKISVRGRELDPTQSDRATWIVRAVLVGREEPAWRETQLQGPGNQYRAIWLPLDRLSSTEVYPSGTAQAASTDFC